MTALSDIPINAYCWFVGGVALFVLGIKSIIAYQRSRIELTKYMIWFSGAFFVCLVAFSIPALFTLNPHTLRTTYLLGELFFYVGMVTQSAILWCLILRRYFSIYYATVLTSVLSLACWLYDIHGARLSLVANNFIAYYDPRVVSFAIILLMIGLFVPVGVYFIRAASWQVGRKATVTSAMLGMMYVGIGLSTSSQELFTRQILSPTSAVVNIVISLLLLAALVMPWKLSVNLPAQVQTSLHPHPS